ncbi:MAG TPA: F0F1 ATP synthase subunit epsilon [Rhizomicrobium sp.]|jgi:F-type H+-transporting ATPase subunit epsilon|nr:F0F1 ATP synthase subunit epsilon [Rhizomicrobium sp.]
MADKIPFDLVSPERLLLTEEAEMVTLPGSEGDLGVLAGHEPLITTLRPGVIDVKGGTLGDQRFFVLGGFAEINPERLTVLAEEALPMADVNPALLDQRISDTREDLLLAKTDTDRARMAQMLDSLTQLRAAL